MARKMTDQFITNGTGTGNLASEVIDFSFSYGYCVQFNIAGTTPNGTAKVQGSIDGVTWVDISSLAVTAAGSVFDNKDAIYYPKLRLTWTFTSGTGIVVNAFLSSKGA